VAARPATANFRRRCWSVVGGHTVLSSSPAPQPNATCWRNGCGDVKDPARILSWVLQCSFIKLQRASLDDPRAKAVVAVVHRCRLFNYGAAWA